jgi:methylenetetrahydrofolate reductase (NADPH)
MDAALPRASRFVHGSAPQAIRVSFEFFPPKTAEMEQALWEAIARLAPLSPNFVSVTYGAGGSTRERTHATVKRILGETMLTPAAHLTCVAATRDEIDAVIAAYADAGVRHIVALRGDPPGGAGERYTPHPGGYRNAADLVAGIKRRAAAGGELEVSVGAYPEKHPDSPSVAADIDMLKAKVDAGANRAITQFFFENDLYFRYLDRVRSRGIDIPIVPGILPVQNFKTTKNFAARCGASVPAWLAERFDGLDDDAATRKLIAAAVAAEQVLDLVDHGVTDFHFYTMNRADLVYAICHLLGLRPHQDKVSPPDDAHGAPPLPVGERGRASQATNAATSGSAKCDGDEGIVFHRSPEGRGRASVASEGEGVRKIQKKAAASVPAKREGA